MTLGSRFLTNRLRLLTTGHHRILLTGRRLLIPLALVSLFGAPTAAVAGTIRVGSGAGCDAATIQGGVDLAQAQSGSDTVQISRHETFVENVFVLGHISTDLIILEGGYDHCTGSRSGSSNILAANNASPAVVINNGAEVALSNMHVIHQNGTALQVAFPNSQLTLVNSWAHFSDLGIGVYSGASLVVDATSRVAGNQNSSAIGGGIHCELPGSNALILGTVALNQSESGAGLYATDGCEIVLAGAQFEDNEATNGGGAIYLGGGAQLTTLDAGVPNIFTGNSAQRGGGIYATDTGTSLELDDALLSLNEATYGGGLYTQSNAHATLKREVDIFDNSATSQGGGVAAYSGGIVSLRDGVSVFGNDATLGGGFYLASGAHLNGSANGLEGIEIRDNQATYGGGLYLTGDGTDAVLYNYNIWSNQAQTAGGGAAVRYGAYFEMNRGNSIPCAAPPRCSQLRNNVLTQGTDGSALYLDNGADAKLYQTYIEHNHHQLHAAQSRVVQARDDGTTLRLEGVQFWQNDGTYLIGSNDSASINAGFVTAARNYWTLDANTELPVLGAVTGNGGGLSLVSSILIDTRGYDGSIFNDCLIVDDATGLTTSSSVLVGVDPRLVDPDSGDLRLQGGSPAIDYCDNFYFDPLDPLDLDLDLRGVDHPDISDVYGFYDLGVDETLESAALFTDGFESGDTTAWE